MGNGVKAFSLFHGDYFTSDKRERPQL